MELSEKLKVAWSRIKKDRSTDFIIGDFEYLVYGAYASELLARLEQRIDDEDEYKPLPLRTIRVPKEAHTTRPGAVPEIDDRIVYQYLVDDIAEAVEPSLVPLEAQVVHSYRYAGDRSSAEMFVGTDQASYRTFTRRTIEMSDAHAYLVATDVADFYERLYHHDLENLLRGLGAPANAVQGVMRFLRQFRRGASYGIPQGIWPSDYLGNLYLDSVDKLLIRTGLDYCRYVDDIRIGVDSVSGAERALLLLENQLAATGLSLNAGKTQIIPRADLVSVLLPYQRRLDEIFAQIREAWLEDVPYEAEVDEPAFDAAVNVASVEGLFREQLARRSPDHSILRFCLRQFRTHLAEDVLDEVLTNLGRLVVVTQAVVPYLVRIARETDHASSVEEKILEYLTSDVCVYDWQAMWLLQALYRIGSAAERTRAHGERIVTDGGSVHDAVLVSAILFLGKHGDHADRELLTRTYDREANPWVKRAILFAVQGLPATRRNHFYAYCRGHDALTDRVVDYVQERH